MPAFTHHHALTALAEAWPFSAPEGFLSALTSLKASKRSDPNSGTGQLAVSFEGAARVLARGQSVAAIELLRDHAWFRDGDDELSLASALARLAEKHLRWDGDTVRLARSSADTRHQRTMAWRWLSLRLPQDLLIAAYFAGGSAAVQMEPCCDRVSLVGRSLAALLESPVADTHLHVGAALDFGEMWIALLHGATAPEFGQRLKEAPAPLRDVSEYRRALVSAALVRQLLAAFLWHREVLPQLAGDDFSEFLKSHSAEIARRTGDQARAGRVERAFSSALAELHTGLGYDTNDRIESMIRAHQLLWGPRRRRPATIEQLLDADPVAAWLPNAPGVARSETRFLYRGLRRLLEPEGARDQGFAQAFWQYLRVRNLVFGHLVESPGTAGLGWFKRHFDRLRGHRHDLAKLVTLSALRLQSRALNLASLELRTAPERRWFEARNQIREIASQALMFAPGPGRRQPEVALVLHFIKQHEEPGFYRLRCRHGRWFHAARQQAEATARALRHNPELLLVFRGLDVAAEEMAVPNWVLLPLFEKIRQAAREAAARLAAERPLWRVTPLRTTLHAGEEFHRPSEGLRRVHEAIEFGLLGEGDRIGHGLVLGWSTKQTHPPVALQPREERLFDLLWELDRYRCGDLSGEAGRIQMVIGQLDRLSRDIFGDPVPSEALLKLRRQLFEWPALLADYNYPFGPRGALPDEPLARYLLDPGLRQRARAPIPVEGGAAETRFFEQAQRWLQGQVGRLTLTVEANPSSNLVIGDFGDFCDHPTFALSAPVDHARPSSTQLPVSINSDDPLTFASSLADEYAYMEAALIGRGHSPRATHQWLDEAREAGWRSRFSLPASAEPWILRELAQRRSALTIRERGDLPPSSGQVTSPTGLRSPLLGSKR